MRRRRRGGLGLRDGMKPRGLEPSQFSLAVGDTGCCRPCLRARGGPWRRVVHSPTKKAWAPRSAIPGTSRHGCCWIVLNDGGPRGVRLAGATAPAAEMAESLFVEAIELPRA